MDEPERQSNREDTMCGAGFPIAWIDAPQRLRWNLKVYTEPQIMGEPRSSKAGCAARGLRARSSFCERLLSDMHSRWAWRLRYPDKGSPDYWSEGNSPRDPRA